MRRLKKIFKWLLYTCLLLIPLVYVLVGTNIGLQFDLFILEKVVDGKLEVKKSQGNLLSQFKLSQINYQSPNIQLHAKTFAFSWSAIKSFTKGLHIKSIELDQFVLNLKQMPASTSEPADQKNSAPFHPIDVLKQQRFSLKNIQVNDLQIHLPEQIISLKSAKLSARSTNEGLFIDDLSATVNQQNITAAGKILYQTDLPVQLLLKTTGNFRSNTKLSGNKQKYTLKTSIKKPISLELTADVQASENDKLNVNLNIKQQKNTLAAQLWLKWQQAISWQGDATVSYNFNGHSQTKIHSEGKWQDDKWFGKSSFNLAGNLLNKKISAQANVNHQTLAINLKSYYGNNKITAQGSWPGIDFNISVPSLAALDPKLPPIRASLQASGKLGEKSHAEINLSAGTFPVANKQLITFQPSKFKLNADQQGLQLAGKLTVDQKKWLTLQLNAPTLFKGKPLKQPVTGEAIINLDDISIIDKFVKDIKNTRGKINGKVQLSGSLSSPKIATQINLQNGQTQIENLGILLKNIELSLKGDPKYYAVKGTLSSGDGFLQIYGNAQLDTEKVRTMIKVSGTNATLYNTEEYKITASPDLQLTGEDNQVFLSGSINIPKAEISPHDFSSTVEIPDDVVIEGQQHPQRSKTFALGYQCQVNLGNDIKLSVMGLKGKLTGDLKLDAPFNQQTTAIGTLKIIDGKYQAYGQNLEVSEGQVIFTGGALNNPGLYVEAIRSFNYQSQYSPTPNQSLDSNNLSIDDFSNKMTVGLHITGRLKSPRIKLFSDPSSENQADILSMLILGRPASQAKSGSDSQLLISALSGLNLGGGSSGQQLTNQLQHALGLDTLGIETQSNYNATTNTTSENSALVIGKSLSSKLSMSYSVGLGQGNNILRIKYQFTPSWALQTETDGSANGVDFIYHYTPKDPDKPEKAVKSSSTAKTN